MEFWGVWLFFVLVGVGFLVVVALLGWLLWPPPPRSDKGESGE